MRTCPKCRGKGTILFAEAHLVIVSNNPLVRHGVPTLVYESNPRPCNVCGGTGKLK